MSDDYLQGASKLRMVLHGHPWRLHMVFERHLVHDPFAELRELTFGRVGEEIVDRQKQNAGLRDAGDDHAEASSREQFPELILALTLKDRRVD